MAGFKWKTQANPDAGLSIANMELADQGDGKRQDLRHEVRPRVRIHVHSLRRKLIDPDGISAKAAIDGLVQGGLLANAQL